MWTKVTNMLRVDAAVDGLSAAYASRSEVKSAYPLADLRICERLAPGKLDLVLTESLIQPKQPYSSAAEKSPPFVSIAIKKRSSERRFSRNCDSRSVSLVLSRR